MNKEDKIATDLDKMAKSLSRKFAQTPIFSEEDGYNVCLNAVWKSLKKYNKSRGTFFGFMRQCMISDLIHESVNTKGFRISRSLFEKKNKYLLKKVNNIISKIQYLEGGEINKIDHRSYTSDIEMNDLLDSVLDQNERIILRGRIFENCTLKELSQLTDIPVYKVNEVYNEAIEKLSSYYKENNLWPKTI